jgi:hypothetical protein
MAAVCKGCTSPDGDVAAAQAAVQVTVMQEHAETKCPRRRRIPASPFDEGIAFVKGRGEGRILLRARAGMSGSCRAVAALCCAAALTLASTARAGHEISYYPSFYPQEIRIEALTPAAAAKEFSNITDPLHAYIGAAPQFAGKALGFLKSAASLEAFIAVRFNPKAAHLQHRDARCRAAAAASSLLATGHEDVVAHAYPITPYHADYVGHVDRVPVQPKLSTPEVARLPPLAARAGGGLEWLLGSNPAPAPDEWDVSFDEVRVADLLRQAGVGTGIWLAPPWAKEGWFQTYHLLRSAVSDPAHGERADTLYDRMTLGAFKDRAEQLNLERDLVAALTHGCERAVIGYRLRREFYSDEFSNGIENIASDTQSGFNSPVAIRTMKLKDFPWNGWLRLGLAGREEAAWNPVAGFTDAAGRLVWSTVGDGAFLPITHNGRWVQNRAELVPDEEERKPSQSMLVPSDALMPQIRSGKLAPVGAGRGAVAKLTYKLAASAFQDGTEMDPADLLYPYALAFRWSEGEANGPTFDPEIAAATALLRARLAGVRIVRVEERSLQLADLTFNYRSPVADVYLNSLASDPDENALVTPPWSSVPWHVLALMEAAVERGLGAFSQSEAKRRGVPWLDLVRDKAQLDKLSSLIAEFARSGYRPAALESLVSAGAARARWQALGNFQRANGHLLVTNGPYRLASWSPQTTVLAVVREFTYPVGLGTFDPFAYPARAIVTGVERAPDRFVITADIEIFAKEQRNHRLVRKPFTRETLRETLAIRPVARYLVVGPGDRVAAAGDASWESDGRFAAPLPAPLAPGSYTLFAAIFVDGNTAGPSVGSLRFESR